MTASDKFSFGFEEVAEDARQDRVNEIFARVAESYDLMNDLMSGGMHRLWKDEMVGWLTPPRGATPCVLLDVAGGTGDIAGRFLAEAGPASSAIICDISAEMLAAGRARHGDLERVAFVQGNAEMLPFEEGRFDAYTIAFGMRNVTHIDRALAEAFRVLRPGGRFLCLEFSAVELPMLDTLYDLYSFNAIPALGQLVAGDSDAYRYLVESIRKFPTQEPYAEMLRRAGFEQVRYRNLTGGIAAIHSGWRI